MMVFRLSFFGAFFVDGTLFLTQLLVFSAIYSQTDSIGGWSQGEMTTFIGTFSLINGLNMVIYFFGINDIPSKIINGNLDHYLTKPIDPLLRLTFENINIGSLPLIFFSIGIVIYGIAQSGIAVTPGKAVIYVLLVILMTVLYYDVELILRTVPFFIISASNITRLEELLVFCMKVPGVLFKGVFKILFYFILPYGIMSTVPTQFISGTLSPYGIIYGIGTVIFFTVFAMRFWRFGLKHYKSSSS
jgi:ABC-2 type transport system permease protein